MCIILSCEAGTRPSDELVEACFFNNPDGAGIMWSDGDRVHVSKGYDDPSQLIRAIGSVPTDSNLVVHMRIATSGGIDVGTCHPFPICHDLDVLHEPDVVCGAAIAHNGVISGVPTDDKRGISDTVYFVSNVVSELYEERGRVTRGMKRRMRKSAPGNRFAIMTKNGDVSLIGSGWETVSRGIQASNGSWRWDDRWMLDEFGGMPWDEFGAYGPEYDDVFEICCGGCKHIGSCMAYGPMCDEVYDAIAAWDEGSLTFLDDVEVVA